MKIGLVQAPRWSALTPPYAVALLTGNLRRHGFTVSQKGFDPDLYRALTEEERLQWYSDSSTIWNDDRSVAALIEKYSAVADRMVEEILLADPNLVGFSVKTWSRVFSLALAERIKRRRPEVYVVFGGAEVGRLPAETFLGANPQVDALCRQEADLSFPRFLNKMQNNGMRPVAEPGFAFRDAAGTVVDCGPVEETPLPADIPFADYRDYDFSRYQNPRAVTMTLSRGCINRCSYCSEAPSFLRYRAYSAKQVFAEIEHHWHTSGCQKPMRIYFNDSLLNGDVAELEALADLLLAHRDRMPIDYGGMMFVRDQLSDALIDKLARSGMSEVLFGLESGSEETLRRMRKKFSLSAAERVFRRFHEAGVSVTASVIFGHPGETEREFYRSLSFLRRNAENVDWFLLNCLGLYGDCDITRHPEKYGVDVQTVGLIQWVADEGRNTAEVRHYRQHIARMLLGPKVCDLGDFGIDGNTFYDPATPLRQKIAQLNEELQESHRQRLECLKIKRFVSPSSRRSVGWLEALREKDGNWLATGWARDPRGLEPANQVILVNQNRKILSLGRPNQVREDVQQALGSKQMLRSGWELGFHRCRLDKGHNVIKAFVYLPEEERAYQLEGEFTAAET